MFTATKSISGSFVFYQNLDTENGLGATPACFSGGMIITSDVPIVGIASYISDLASGDQEGVYNGIPIPQ